MNQNKGDEDGGFKKIRRRKGVLFVQMKPDGLVGWARSCSCPSGY